MRDSPLLDRRITLHHAAKTGGRGKWNQSETYPVEETVWAARRDVSGRENIENGLVSLLQVQFTIRYRQDVTASWSVVSDGAKFRVESIREIGRRRYLELQCVNASGG